MPRSFEVSAESPVTVEQVHAAFSREDYWLARRAAFDVGGTFDSLVVESDGTVTVVATQHVGRQLLPGMIAKLVRGDLKIVHSEMWRPVGDHRLHGQVSISAPASLGSGRADASVVPSGNGSVLRFMGTVEIKIPFMGGKLEKAISTNLTENLPLIQRFTTSWIAENVS